VAEQDLQPEEKTPAPNRLTGASRMGQKTQGNMNRGGRIERPNGVLLKNHPGTPQAQQPHQPATKKADDLEKSFAKPAIENFRRNARQSKPAQAQQAAKFLKKNKKWLIGGGAAFGLLLPIVAFFLWMMLFKNVHIKNLYVTYRWAQFNRGLNKTLKAQLSYIQENPDVKPKGKIDTTVQPTDSVEDLTKKTNADFDPATIDPDVEANRLAQLEKSPAGSSSNVIETRSVKAVGDLDGATPDERATSAEKKAKANVEESFSEKGKIDGVKPSAGIEDGVKEVQDQTANGKPAPEAVSDVADSVARGGDGWKGALSKASTLVFVSTIYCIFSDLYSNGKEELNKIALNGSMGIAQELNKTADCQKMGECDLDQVGAVANRYDNGEESYLEACATNRAEGSSNPGCKEIDPKFIVNGMGLEIGKIGGISLDSADAILDPPDLSVKLGPLALPLPFDEIRDTTCKAVMNPIVQGGITIAEGAAIIGTGGGWAALGKGVGAGVAQAAGTAGGKALIASYLTKMSGSLYKNLTPTEVANITDMGNMVTASASCQASYCPQVSDATLSMLNRDYQTERIAANSKRSVLEKFFDTTSPDSVVVRVALNSPATPQTVFARVKGIFASISNPVKLNKAIGDVSIDLTRNNTALAVENSGAGIYGLSGKAAVPPSLLEDVTHESIVAWAKNSDLSQYSKYDKCANNKYADLIVEESDLCSWDGPMKNDGGRMYMQYKYTQNAAFKNALLRNNQNNLKSSGSDTGATGPAQPTNAEEGIDTSDPAKWPCPAGALRTIVVTFQKVNIGLCTIGGRTQVNASAAQAFYDMRLAAEKDGIVLDGGGYRDNAEQIRLRKAHCPDWQNSRANDCRPPTAKPGTSMHEEGLAVDYENSKTRSTPVYQWLAKNAARFGIKNLPSEPWHWSVNGG